MFLKALHKGFILCLSVFLIGLAQVTAAHAAEHGAHPHEHEGEICQLVIALEPDTITLPPEPISQLTITSNVEIPRSYWAALDQTLQTQHQQRAPPPRGPPLIINPVI